MMEFEIRNNNGDIEHVTVMEMFIHKYTKETMRRVRIDGLKPFSTHAMSRIDILNEDEYGRLLERRTK